jgi:dTMP kinase
MTGMFITLEGGDGTGKTTQAEAIRLALEARGDQVLRTREPGGTELGVKIRELLLHTPGHIDPRAEALLFAADRAHHIATLVRPALEAGTHVVQDRYIDSSVAYQGAGRALDGDQVRGISEWATNDLIPDLTVLLDLDPVVAAERVAGEGKSYDRMEAEKNEFRARLRDGFLDIAEANAERFLVVDATLPIEQVTAIVVAEVERQLSVRRALGVR